MLHQIRYIFVVVFFFLTTAATVSAQTDSITLIWEPNTEPNLAGYNLYYKRDTSGPPYDGTGLDQDNSPITIYLSDRMNEKNHLSDDNNPEFELTGMVDGVTYYVTLTAFNDEGLESGYSNEVSYPSQEPADLDHVEIEGPQTISENSTAQFILRAYFINNTNRQVNATSWEVICADASISNNGVLTTEDVTVNTQGTVSATYFSGGLTRSDEIQVTVTDTDTSPPPSPNQIVMDNGDPGTSYTGKWKTSKDNSFDRPSVFCRKKKKEYTFETQLEGNYNVSFMWTKKAKAKKVPVKIYDGNTLIDTVYVNQRKNRNIWNLLGTYAFSGLARVTVISKKHYTVVDGMKFEQ